MKPYQHEILNSLLDKFERRAETSRQRVILHCDKLKYVPHPEESAYSDFLIAMLDLQERELIGLEWIREGYVIDRLWLELPHADQAYEMLNRPKKAEKLTPVLNVLDETARQIKTEWIQQFLQDSRASMEVSGKPEGIWSLDTNRLTQVLDAFSAIDRLCGETVSMRVFSLRMYADSKLFEREIKKRLVPIITKYEPVIADLDEISEREALAQVGILMMPEIFEFCGGIKMHFPDGAVDFSPMLHGGCISGNSVQDIEHIELNGVTGILLIENKTNYAEYCMHRRRPDELVIYHGGFYSPLKGDFLRKIFAAADGISIRFWADIDLGGFKMFVRLREQLVPGLQAYGMDLSAYRHYCANGLRRSAEYLGKLERLRQNPVYSQFADVIDAILETGVTVEQEAFFDPIPQQLTN